MNRKIAPQKSCDGRVSAEPHTKRLSFNAFVSGHVRPFGFGRKKTPKHFCCFLFQIQPKSLSIFSLSFFLFHLNTHVCIIHRSGCSGESEEAHITQTHIWGNKNKLTSFHKNVNFFFYFRCKYINKIWTHESSFGMLFLFLLTCFYW